MEQRFEYLVRFIGQYLGQEKELNLVAKDGWKLILMNGEWFYFERPFEKRDEEEKKVS